MLHSDRFFPSTRLSSLHTKPDEILEAKMETGVKLDSEALRKKHNQHERIYQRLQILTSIFFFIVYHIVSSLESGFKQYTVKFTLCFVTLKNTLKVLLSLRLDCFRLRRMTSCNFVLKTRNSCYFLRNKCTLFRGPPMFATRQCYLIR